MPSHTRLMVICAGLAATFSCTAAGFAQSEPAPQLNPAGTPTLAGAPSNIPWHTFEWIERRYKIEAVRFKARDETGIDWPGSDEVTVGTFDAKGSTVSDEFGDIDSGDTGNFDPAKSCIVAVRPGTVVLGKTSVCNDVGEPAPLGFEVEFWEKGVFEFPSGFCIFAGPPPGHHAMAHCLDDGNGDDLIGRARLDFPMHELEAALPNVGDQRTETAAVFPCPPTVDTCGAFDFADYTFTYRITRLPDVSVGLLSLLNEAMPKIGARSEFEAIIAGLRSLRPLDTRTKETETVNLSLGR